MNQIQQIYQTLLKEYGKQGWWPIISNKTLLCEYNGGPKNDAERFEVCIGAILTQNTSWVQVEKALQNLAAETIITPIGLKKLEEDVLKNAIKPAGYFNQKAKKLLLFIEFYESLEGRIPTREELLSVWGIGKETADSILLYAFNVPVFVVDAYTRRLFSVLRFIDKDAEYDDIQKMFEDALPKDFVVYQEYHALIVEHAKRSCKTKPECLNCILKNSCKI